MRALGTYFTISPKFVFDFIDYAVAAHNRDELAAS